MKRLDRVLATLFLGAAGLLVATVFFTYMVGLAAIKANRAMVSQREIMHQLDQVLSILKDAETGQRGYLLTGKEVYLEPYRAALKELGPQRSALQQLADTGSLPAAGVSNLNARVQAKLQELELTIQLKRTNAEAALAVVESDRGKATMDRIRAQIASLSSVEEQEYRQAADRVYWSALARTVAFVVAALVNLGFLAWTFKKIRQENAIRERLALEIMQQKEVLSTTLVSIGDGVVVTDEQGRVDFLNTEAKRLTGWEMAEAKGKLLPEIFKIVNEETRKTVENPVEKVLRLGQVVGLANHTVLIAKDGKETAIDDSAAPIRDPSGRLFGVVLVFRDFTEHKESERKLSEQRELLRVTLASIGDAVLATDAAGRVSFINPVAVALTGWPAAEAAGRPVKEVFRIINEHTRQPAEDIHARVIAEKRVVGLANHTALVARDGREIPIEDSAAPILDDGGRVLGTVLVFHDVTERRRVEAELRRQERLYAENLEKTVQERTVKLSEMVSELQHVSYSMVHDMRAPLRAMSGFAETLREGYLSGLKSDEVNDYCQRILTGAHRLDRLVTDALSYTRTVLMEMPMEAVNLSILVRGILDTYPNLHPDHADIRVEGELPSVIGNESLLTQCFSNLLGNAVKFVAPGTRPRVLIKSLKGNGIIRISIQDNGIGISESAQRRLFGMFQKLDNRYDGTGIGLAIVRKVVERMGGRTGVESQPGMGSTFWVELKLV